MAATEVGAPTVLTVSAPGGKDIATVVDKADPSGHLAAGVLSYTDLSQNSSIPTLLAVQPQRFAAVAASTSGFGPAQRRALERELDPPAAPEISVSDDDPFRLTFKVDKVSGPGAGVTADFTEAAGGYQALYLGALPTHGTVTLTQQRAGRMSVHAAESGRRRRGVGQYRRDRWRDHAYRDAGGTGRPVA